MPTSYLSPGVYIEEVNTGPRPIEAVATAVAAFVGIAPYSSHTDANRPVLITSWTQYCDKFGKPDKFGQRNPHLKDAYMSHAVFGYFLNGGTRCYVTRVMPREELPKLKEGTEIDVIAGKPGGAKNKVLGLKPKGVLPNEVQVALEAIPGVDPTSGTFQVRVRTNGKEEPNSPYRVALSPSQETPAAETPTPEASASGSEQAPGDTSQKKGKGTSTHVTPPDSSGSNNQPALDTRRNLLAGSMLVELREEILGNIPIADRMPQFGIYYLAVPQPSDLSMIKQQEFIGDTRMRSGVAGLELAEEVTMVLCPDLVSKQAYPNGTLKPDSIQAVQKAMIDYCALIGGRMAIIDTPPDLDPQGVAEWRNTVNYDSMHAALYYPWITIANPRAGEDGEEDLITVPPCGHMAGIYARNDSTRGVFKAPANEEVRGSLRLAYDVSKSEQDGLNPIGINCIRSFTGRGIRVWGARTLASDPAWKYINVRRLFNMVEKSIERNTQWVVFEPNDPGLWSRVRRDISAFLTVQWRDGALFGNSPQEAFYVKCDVELNPQETRDLGWLIIEVGMAPVKPAEFVIFRFSQYAGGGA